MPRAKCLSQPQSRNNHHSRVTGHYCDQTVTTIVADHSENCSQITAISSLAFENVGRTLLAATAEISGGSGL